MAYTSKYTGAEIDERLSRVYDCIRNQGEWSEIVTYAINDMVNYSDSWFLCTAANTGQTPSSDSSYWISVGSAGSYTLSETDKNEIANVVLTLLTDGDEVSY